MMVNQNINRGWWRGDESGLSPFFTSLMKDFGHDVADHRDVEPMFGTLDDFKRLVARGG